jgi:hypothetical protein
VKSYSFLKKLESHDFNSKKILKDFVYHYAKHVAGVFKKKISPIYPQPELEVNMEYTINMDAYFQGFKPLCLKIFREVASEWHFTVAREVPGRMMHQFILFIDGNTLAKTQEEQKCGPGREGKHKWNT